jgi:hypothetical protein
MTSVLGRCVALLRVPANEIAFAVRASLRWSRGTPRQRDENDRATLAALPHRTADLVHRFALESLQRRATGTTFAKNLALLANLEHLAGADTVPAAANGVVRATDVGSGDFHYATALQRWLSLHRASRARPVALRGIELDGHGVYRDGHSRRDHGRAHAALAAADPAGSTVDYVVADASRTALAERGEQDVVTMLFPFLTVYPLLRWGLPLSRFRPRRLLRNAVAALRPGGWLVVANQTEVEFDRLRALLAGASVRLVRRVSFASELAPQPERTADQVGSLWVRT